MYVQSREERSTSELPTGEPHLLAKYIFGNRHSGRGLYHCNQADTRGKIRHEALTAYRWLKNRIREHLLA